VILATAENLPLTAGACTAAVMSMVFFFPGRSPGQGQWPNSETPQGLRGNLAGAQRRAITSANWRLPMV